MNGLGTYALEVLGRAVPRILAAAAPHGGGSAADDARVVNERRIHGENSKVEANEREMTDEDGEDRTGCLRSFICLGKRLFPRGTKTDFAVFGKRGSRRYVNDRRC